MSANSQKSTIAFIVKKPAQFDVPFFRFIHHYDKSEWNWVVVYTEDPAGEIVDHEMGQSSKWGIDLLNGYEWHHVQNDDGDAILNLLKAISPRLVITNGYKASYKPFVEAAQRLGVPVCLRIDSVLFAQGRGRLAARKLMMKWRYKKFSAFLTTGKVGYEYLDFIGIPKHRQGWFPYCIDIEFFKEAVDHGKRNYPFSFRERHRVILAICKFLPRENPVELMNAFCRMNDSDLQLIMIGDGPLMSELKAIAAKHPHLDINLPGYVPYTELPSWYHRAGVFVHAAQDEPWGVSVQEAIAAGCRVVASDKVGSAFDLVSIGNNGYIYPVNNIEALVSAIRQALQIKDNVLMEANRQVLQQWNYESVWLDMQASAARLTA